MTRIDRIRRSDRGPCGRGRNLRGLGGSSTLAAQQADAEGANAVIPWAYTLNDPPPADAPPPPDPDEVLRVPGSDVTFRRSELRDLFNPPDWHPDNHPPPPPVVASGRRPDVRACGFCHLPNGQGRPENSSVAGQPAEYIVQQMRDYRTACAAAASRAWARPA